MIELYEYFKENEREFWVQVSLSVTNEGEFNIDFFYDVMTEDNGGQVSEEGSFSRKLLEDCLKEED